MKIKVPEFSIWYIILVFLVISIITWFWFNRQIGTIDSQIELLTN